MILTEETFVPEGALPVDALKRHLRLGTGFDEDDVQDAVLASFLRASLAAIEARTGKALIARRFLLTLPAWSDPCAQALPLAPVSEVISVTRIDRFGAATELALTALRLELDAHRPRLVARSGLPALGEGGRAELRLVAGYAESFGDLPADLAQAVLLLAAHYYEYRDETALGQGCMPFGVTALLQRYRQVRMGFAS
ncbi:head-tail connector protein [Litorisediminicola beolgyonensis]|uniref:Head-tail connector protein n=1 Tax=Litorisediminicola beolgyonensis TaxID=1173614 RepID=A0ABW3ZPG7_9RHOB